MMVSGAIKESQRLSEPKPARKPRRCGLTGFVRASCSGGKRSRVVLVRPGRMAAEPRRQEQDRKLQKQQLTMDEGIDRPLPPTRLPLAIACQPIVIRRPMAGLVLLD